MAVIESAGYPGDILGVDWALLAEDLLGNSSRIVSGFAGTAVAAGTRQVSVSPGTAYGWGVRDVMRAATTLQFPVVSSGSRWDCVALRRDWSALGSGRFSDDGTKEFPGKSDLVVITGTASEALPSTLRNSPGVVVDQPLLLVQHTAGQTVATAIRRYVGYKRSLHRQLVAALVTGQGDSANVAGPEGERWPNEAFFTVPVPTWATRVSAHATWVGVLVSGGDTDGDLWIRANGQDFQRNRYDHNQGNVIERPAFHAATNFEVPEALRGRTMTFEGRATASAASVVNPAMDSVSSWVLDLDWTE